MSKDQSKKNLSRVSVKKKVWYKILSPKQFGQMEIGETYLSTPEEAVGRTLKINLKDITGNMKDQSAYVKFKVDSIEGTALKTSAIGYELTATYVKKMVRKNTDRLDDFMIFRSKDGKTALLKILIITQHKAQRSVQKQLKQKAKMLLGEELRKDSFDVFITNLVTRKTQILLKKMLHKIHPVNEVAIRMLGLQKEGTVVTEVPQENAPAEVSEASEEESEEIMAEEEAAPAA
ncbi:MAG: hypothetical protein AABX05_04615 [Nanoarchaeota archaeon]